MTIQEKINHHISEIYKITGVKIERVSRHFYKDDVGYVYENQILTSLEVIYQMVLATINPNVSRYIMISAQPQVGKTGVVGNILFLLEYYDKLSKFIKIDFGKSLIITPMSDIANKQQLQKDIYSQSGCRRDKKRLLKDDGIMHNPDMLNVLRNNNYESYRNSIIFMDESHLASHSTSVNNKFLQEKKIFLNGFKDLNDENLFLLTISATPYEEQICNYLCKNKSVIELIPGDGYRGIKYFYEHNLLRQSFDLSDFNKFKNELKQFNNKKGYYIVRIKNSTDIRKLVPEGWNFLTYYEKDKVNINNIISHEPIVPTLIFIKQKMMQSYQLNKENVVMMFDRTSNYYKNRTNFVVQSFVGRACGYHNNDIIIYTDLENVKYHIDYLNNPNNIPESKYCEKKVITNNNCTKLIKLNFDTNKKLFNDILLLENKKYNKDDMIRLISSEFNIEVLQKYKEGKAIYNSNFFYSKENESYDDYITKAYNDIDKYNGMSTHKFLREIYKYKTGDLAFAIYVDKDNYNVIIAYVNFIEDNTESYFYNFKSKPLSSYSPDCKNVDTNIGKRDIAYIMCEGKLNDASVYLNRDSHLVLAKNSKVCKVNVPGWIENNIVIKDIKIECKTNDDKLKILNKYCSLISNTNTINDFKCGDKKFVDVLTL